MIDLTINEEQLGKTVKRAREKNIIIPTFEQMKNPKLIPEKIKNKLKNNLLQGELNNDYRSAKRN